MMFNFMNTRTQEDDAHEAVEVDEAKYEPDRPISINQNFPSFQWGPQLHFYYKWGAPGCQ